MYRLTADITISGERKWRLGKVTEVEITRDTEQLTDTCRITLPKRVRWDGESEVPVRRGDGVTVSLGYDDSLQQVFVGYVRDVSLKTPVVLTCEDEMFVLKQMEAKKNSYRNVDLATLLKDQGLAANYTVKVMGEQNIGQYRVQADTVAALLENLHESGIRSFFRQEDGKPVLYCGVLFEHGDAARPSQVFESSVNIIDDGGLEQRKAEDMRIRVTAVSFMPENDKRITVEVGDSDGERRTLHAKNMSEDELRVWAEQEVTRLKRDGLTGSFTTFGYRLVDLLDTVGIRIDGERKGIYQVSRNVIRYGTSGFRQEITLGQRTDTQ
ncbi:MAG: hypothetical protein LUC33_04520 [Prevotellaceae bacterium]|nr:hypothetical protein [Prevotellaceae bacterium]